LSYYVRQMTRQDLDDVTAIDREAFATQWPPADYGYEFRNHMAHYVVACDSGTSVERLNGEPARRALGALGRLLDRVFGRRPPQGKQVTVSHYIVGFAGFWVMAGEAHVSSIAVRAQHRREGIGEMLLIAVLDLALELQADVVTLEVRVSNKGAQDLYAKFGFKEVGERRRYYLDRGPSGDTREDALIMTTDTIRTKEFQGFLGRLKEGRAARGRTAAEAGLTTE
jgi:ribosomal-protein-alanine N-acetyltransferase